MNRKCTKTCLTIALLGCAISALADTGIAYVIEPQSRAAYEVVTTKVGDIVRPLGYRGNLSVNAFAGLGDKSRPIGGFSLSYRGRLAENVTLDVGPALFVSERKPSGVALFIGVSWRF